MNKRSMINLPREQYEEEHQRRIKEEASGIKKLLRKWRLNYSFMGVAFDKVAHILWRVFARKICNVGRCLA